MLSNMLKQCVLVASLVVLIMSLTGSAVYCESEKDTDDGDLKFEELGHNGVNILILTPYTDSLSLWEICKYYKGKMGSTSSIIMLSFFEKMPAGKVSEYLLSDYWWASYNYNKNSKHESLAFTGYGRKEWGKPRNIKPKVNVAANEKTTIEYSNPSGFMWSGIKLYYGPGMSKKYIGEIVCFYGSDWVKVRFASGSLEWKDRDAIINVDGSWFIDKKDPAIKAKKYVKCNDSP